MAWHRPGAKPLSEPMMVTLAMQICVTRPQWVKEREKEHINMHNENEMKIYIMKVQRVNNTSFLGLSINSPRLNDVMAYHLIGAKPLSDTMLYYCQMDA